MRFPSPPRPAPNRTLRPWARPLRRLRPLPRRTAETAPPEKPSMPGNPWPLLSAPNAKTFHSSPRKPSSTRRLLCLSTIKRNFQKRKNALQISRFPPSAARKTKKRRHPSAFAKKPQTHANKNTAIPLHGALKKSLHEHSRFSLCPPNSAIRAPQLKDSLPPTRHLPSCARMAALPSPCRPCLRAVRALAPCFLFGIFFIYHSSIRYYPVISTQVRYKIHIHLIIKRLFPAPSSCATFQKRAVICPRSGMFLLAKHSSKPHAPFQSAQKRAVLGQERRFPNLK